MVIPDSPSWEQRENASRAPLVPVGEGRRERAPWDGCVLVTRMLEFVS